MNDTDKVKLVAKLNKIAKSKAKFVEDQLMHIHRGMLEVAKDVAVIFGNDCYRTDPRSQKEAEAVLSEARRQGIVTSDIQTDKSGGTWAIAVFGDNSDSMARWFLKIAWDAWLEASGVGHAA